MTWKLSRTFYSCYHEGSNLGDHDRNLVENFQNRGGRDSRISGSSSHFPNYLATTCRMSLVSWSIRTKQFLYCSLLLLSKKFQFSSIGIFVFSKQGKNNYTKTDRLLLFRWERKCVLYRKIMNKHWENHIMKRVQRPILYWRYLTRLVVQRFIKFA